MGLINNATKEKVYKLRAEGLSYEKISKTLGIAKQTVVNITKEGKEAIATLRAMELEALYESQKINHEERIKALSSIRKKIRRELDKRDFTDVTSDKLLEAFLKTESAIREEMVEPMVQSSDEQIRDQEEREYLDSF